MKLVIAFLLCISAAVALINPAPVKFVALSTAFTSPVGIDYHATSDTVITSVYYDQGGNPYNFERVLLDGSKSQFSTVSGLTDEVKIATVRAGNPQFAAGDLFTGTGVPGHVVRISADGNTVTNPWVALGSNTGLMRGSLYVDQTGVWGHDLIVCTTSGYVFRINGAAQATYIDNAGRHLEGLITVPNEPVYGELAGRILAGDEGNYLLWSWDVTGNRKVWSVGAAIEDLDFSVDGENFFGVNYGSSRLLGASGHQFPEGAIIATQEFPVGGTSGLFVLQYDFSINAPVVTPIPLAPDSTFISQWEHVTFAPAGIVEVPPTNDCDNRKDFFGAVASLYNGFSLGDFICYNSDAEGRIAAKLNVDLKNYAVGSKLYSTNGQTTAYGSIPCNTIPAAELHSLVAGNDLSFFNAEVRVGDAVYGNALFTDASARVACNYTQLANAIDFTAAATTLNTISTGVNNLATTGASSFVNNWLLVLNGSTNAEVEVFDLTGIDLTQVHGYELINCHVNASIFINVPGTSVAPGAGSFIGQFSSLRNHIVWNFHAASSLTLNGLGWEGSILAPGACIGAGNGNVNGQVMVGCFNGGWSCLELHDYPFEGCIPPNTPKKP